MPRARDRSRQFELPEHPDPRCAQLAQRPRLPLRVVGGPVAVERFLQARPGAGRARPLIRCTTPRLSPAPRRGRSGRLAWPGNPRRRANRGGHGVTRSVRPGTPAGRSPPRSPPAVTGRPSPRGRVEREAVQVQGRGEHGPLARRCCASACDHGHRVGLLADVERDPGRGGEVGQLHDEPGDRPRGGRHVGQLAAACGPSGGVGRGAAGPGGPGDRRPPGPSTGRSRAAGQGRPRRSCRLHLREVTDQVVEAEPPGAPTGRAGCGRAARPGWPRWRPRPRHRRRCWR